MHADDRGQTPHDDRFLADGMPSENGRAAFGREALGREAFGKGDDDAAVRPALSLAEARLFARAAEGDREAIGEVWRANRRWIAAVLAAHAPRGADIDDLLQEVASTLITKCHHLRDAASLRGWLRVVAVNTARMAARSRSSEVRTQRGFADVRRGLERRAHTLSQAASDAGETLALLSRLPQQYAEPLLLQATQGLSQRQIAELLDVPETTVETRLARARRMLRQMQAELEAGGASMESRTGPRPASSVGRNDERGR